MTNQHPITPPPELVQQWEEDWHHSKVKHIEFEPYIAAQAAQWGADQELLACGNYLKQCAQWEEEDVTEFYNYRRPKPPSLKELALEALDQADKGLNKSEWQQCSDTIRRALEALPDG
jgi:hypothetical protein